MAWALHHPTGRELSEVTCIDTGSRCRLSSFTVCCLQLTCAVAALAVSPVRAQTLYPAGALVLSGDFAGAHPGKVARDLSGIACMPPSASGARVCLTVNDENQSAQFVTVGEDKLVVADELKLVDGHGQRGAVGVRPRISCPGGTGKFAEFDGEGVAFSEPYFYVAGSHGCSRRTGEFRLSSFYLARIRVDEQGRPVGTEDGGRDRRIVERSHRLSDALRRATGVSQFLGKDLARNGVNIEGIAVRDGWLVVGLRAPVVEGKAFLVRVRVEDLFAPGIEPLASDPQVRAISLGADRGVRDLAFLPDGRLLVLAGPAQDQQRPYGLLVVDAGLAAAKPIGDLAPVLDAAGKPAKAEGVTLLESDRHEAVILVLFDGLENGGPRKYRLSLPN